MCDVGRLRNNTAPFEMARPNPVKTFLCEPPRRFFRYFPGEIPTARVKAQEKFQVNMLKLTNQRSSEPSLQAMVGEAFSQSPALEVFVGACPDRAAPAGPGDHVRGGLPPRVLRRVKEHIDAHIDKRISVEALARVANLSVCYFVRAFKQSAGVTPHDYVIRKRVERARALLCETDLSLSEIALAAGFADQSHCARRFREHVGMSPRAYRWSIP
jgi:AraC family transcriptional regulator